MSQREAHKPKQSFWPPYNRSSNTRKADDLITLSKVKALKSYYSPQNHHSSFGRASNQNYIKLKTDSYITCKTI